MASPTSVIDPVTTTARRGRLGRPLRAPRRRRPRASRTRYMRVARRRPASDDRGEVVGVDARARSRTSGDVEPRVERGELGDDAAGRPCRRARRARSRSRRSRSTRSSARGERLGTVRVVGGVDETRRLDADQLQATGRGRRAPAPRTTTSCVERAAAVRRGTTRPRRSRPRRSAPGGRRTAAGTGRA